MTGTGSKLAVMSHDTYNSQKSFNATEGQYQIMVSIAWLIKSSCHIVLSSSVVIGCKHLSHNIIPFFCKGGGE